MAYIIKMKNGRTDGRIWKNKSLATQHIKAVIKNNNLKQRQQTGFIGLKVKKIRPNQREKQELKKADKFIWN